MNSFLPQSTLASLKDVRKVHFIGIGGSGMSGIAEILANSGYKVSGSDVNISPIAERLQRLGVKFYQGHHFSHVNDTDVVVASTAIQENNPEILAAREKNIPIIARAQMLGELMRQRYGISIAGTHGKTTTTSLVSTVLTEGGVDPTFVIGGILKSAETNAVLGQSPYIVVEADESDASFLYLPSKIAVITNIDADHIWFYGGDFNNIRKIFLKFIDQLPEDGLVIVCIDDAEVRELLPQFTRPYLTYGMSEDAEVRATEFKQNGTKTSFVVHYKNETPIEITLNLPGRHNVLNALATYCVARHLNVSAFIIQRALKNFEGVGRRFQQRGLVDLGLGQALLIDDYGHHPREMAVTIEALRLAWPDRRLVYVFQPHRYTRTLALFDDFVRVLSSVDQLVLMDVYSAGEEAIKEADGPSLFKAVEKNLKLPPVFVSKGESLIQALQPIVQEDDILLLQGAGDIGNLAVEISQKFGVAHISK